MLRKILLMLVVDALTAIAGGDGVAWAAGGVNHENYTGYFAPAWNEDGDRIYVLKRETEGLVWIPSKMSLGIWGSSTPVPTLVTRDRFELLRLDPATGATERLQRWDGSPLVGRKIDRVGGCFFDILEARLEPTEDGVDVLLKMNVPQQPFSEESSLDTRWTEGGKAEGTWKSTRGANTAPPDAVLRNGRELITLPGPECFDAAVLVVDDKGNHQVVAHSPDFKKQYGQGVPDTLIAQRSNRARIEAMREFKRVEAELVARFKAEGLSDNAAAVRAYDEMETLGYLPKSPRLIATRIDMPPQDVPIFEIPERYLRVGLFQDIAAAIATPGAEIEASTADYMQYENDPLGPRLRAHLEAGNDRFVVKIEGRFYLMRKTSP